MNMQTEESVVELAINETGFGKFSIKITIISYLIYLNCAMTTAVTGFILPSAACDFQMNTVKKGLFGTAFLTGSCISPILCGFLSSIKGRKWVLLVSLFLQGHSELLQSFVSNYWAIMALKVLSGMAATGQLFASITYLSECIPSKQRNSLLSLMEFFWISGHALASGLAIIPRSFEYRNEYFFFRSWNLYVLICSLPAFLLGFWFTFFPETPKYLAEMGSSKQLLQLLISMYEQNVGKPGKNYIEKLMNSDDCSIVELVIKARGELSVEKKKNKFCLRTNILKELKHFRSVLKLKNTFFACIGVFCSTSAYYTLFLWFPEIFQRFADFDAQNQNGSSSNICTISSEKYSLDSNRDEQDPFGCLKSIDTSVFINNLYLCAACVPAIFPMIILVNRLGLKFFITFYSFICLAVILGLYFVNSSSENLILLCVYYSLISVCLTSSFAFFVTIFPTNLRSSGVTLTSFSSRIGGVFGNSVFSYLIDNNCFSLIVVVASQLLVTGITTVLIRHKEQG